MPVDKFGRSPKTRSKCYKCGWSFTWICEQQLFV